MCLQYAQVRDITQIFISRAQLLPAGETIEDHQKWQKDEADIVEKDKKNNTHGGGLFAGRFKRSRHHNASAIRDIEDGVDRCPMCAWELTEDGRCTSCAFEFFNGHALSDSASLSVSEITEDDDDTFYMGNELELFDTLDPDTMSSLEEPADRNIIHFRNLNHRRPPRTSAAVETRAPHVIAAAHRARRSLLLPGLESPSLRMITDDEFGDTNDDTSEEDDLGSLRDFVVEEGETEDGNPRQLSPRSSHYDSDEASSIFEALGSYSTDEQSDDQGDNNVSQENSTHDSSPGSGANSPNIISTEDDDSDEGPVLRSRTRANRRSNAPPDSNGTAGHGVLPITRRRRNTRGPRRQASGPSTRLLPPGDSQTSTISGSSSTASRAISIETNSRFSLPSLVRQPWTTQRRSAPSRIISDDEDDAATVSSGNTSAVSHPSSSGTMTAGRRSPAGLNSGNQGDLAAVGPSIIISSSPGRLNALAYQRAYSSFSVEYARGPNSPNLEPTHELVQRSVRSPGSRRPYNSSWRSRRRNRSSSHARHAAVLRNNTSTSHSHTNQGNQQQPDEWTARQVARILKKDRPQRRARERAAAGLGPPVAPTGLRALRPGSFFNLNDPLFRTSFSEV